MLSTETVTIYMLEYNSGIRHISLRTFNTFNSTGDQVIMLKCTICRSLHCTYLLLQLGVFNIICDCSYILCASIIILIVFPHDTANVMSQQVNSNHCWCGCCSPINYYKPRRLLWASVKVWMLNNPTSVDFFICTFGVFFFSFSFSFLFFINTSTSFI